ncbi:ATP-binding protein [Streptomyces mirabilis]|nr:ATP-binding protein [Streptomyces mirabilis]
MDAATEAPPLADGEAGADEIGQVGRSFNTARLAAVEAAVKQATLRRGLFAVLLNIARRNQALVHRQLKLVDTLERRTEDPDVLDDLFRIDHLTTRMRRHAESLIILSGAAPGRRWRRPVPVARVVASAVGEIEEYARVVVPPMPEVGVAADAVADVVHLIAELVENATVFSPPHTQVTLRTGRAGGGFVLEIDDRGLGLEPEQIEEAHRTLTTPDDFDPTRHDRLGLYVVGRLAARHGIEVTLCRSPYGGTTAVVLLPEAVLAPVDPERPEPAADTDPRALPSRTSRTSEASRTSETSRKGTAVLEKKREAPDRHTDRAEEQPAAPQRHADRAEKPREAPLRHADRVPETAPATSPPALPTRVRQTSSPRTAHRGPGHRRAVRARGHPEEVRAVFGAFQRGLDRGRKGLPTGSGSERRTDTEEGTDADDAP